MTNHPPVPLFFITGFLGSGKTTLLNRILEDVAARGKTAGVIINEWGRVNIDANLIQNAAADIEELNNGQVFCTCLSGNFLEALARFTERPLDLVLVETSGMANPFPLRKLLADLKRKTGGHYAYQGMAALVDTESFLELVQDINAVEEQVIASQRVIINKVDLAAPGSVEQIETVIRKLNPGAEIIKTSHARVEGFLDIAMPPAVLPSPLEGGFAKRTVKTPYPRPGQYILTTEESVPEARAEAFVRAILPGALRVKGLLWNQASGRYYIDGVNDTVSTRRMDSPGRGAKMVIIPKAGQEMDGAIADAWTRYCGTAFLLA